MTHCAAVAAPAAGVAVSIVASNLPTATTVLSAGLLLRQGTHSLVRVLCKRVGGFIRIFKKFDEGESSSQSLAAFKRDNGRNNGQRKRNGKKDSDDRPTWKDALIEIFPRLVAFGLWYLSTQPWGDSIYRIKGGTVTTRFSDIAGCDEAKHEISEFVDFLKNPDKYQQLGAKSPKGALLCGPPGTGKTLLAKAVAGEANVPFFSVSGTSFIEMYVGVGASRVRELFKAARKRAPCIIFIDEVEAVGRKRGSQQGGGGIEFQNTLNQLLVEMDGFDSKTGVVVFAATNRPNELDSAFTRAGRFDRKIELDPPDLVARKALFHLFLQPRNSTLEGGNVEEFSSRLAELTPGMVGADIANICNEAAIFAVRKNLTKVDIACFEAAIDREIGGMEVRKVISPEEKRTIAFHEAGHAVSAWFLEHSEPVLQATVIPRSGGTLGFVRHLPKDRMLHSREYMLDRICVFMAGRASEQVQFGKYTDGALNDLQHATQIAYSLVKDFGMSEVVGQVSYGPTNIADRFFSDATGELMDREVRSILQQQYERAVALIEEHREQVQQIVELLQKKETIYHEDFVKVLGERSFNSTVLIPSSNITTEGAPTMVSSEPVAADELSTTIAEKATMGS